MAETVAQRVGIDRCQGPLHSLFALTLMELAKFDWRRPTDHEWEVGRWPGLQLTLLARPQWRSDLASFAICPSPGSDGDVPFILLIAFRHDIESSYPIVGDTSVSVSTSTTVELQRDVRMCAHRAFDAALWLQLPHLESRYLRTSPRILPTLPCMKAMMEIQYRFTAPAAAIHRGGLPIPMTDCLRISE